MKAQQVVKSESGEEVSTIQTLKANRIGNKK